MALGEMSGLRGQAPEAPGSLWTAYQAAQAEVEAGWQQVAEDSASQDEVKSQLGLLRAAVARAVQGEPAEVELPRNVLSRRLVEVIRRGFIAHASRLPTPPSPASLLHFLGALETVYQALEPDWAQHFADRLSGPDGLELVVEVAHDIRSPLTSILFLAETLQRGQSGPVSPVQERQLGLIYSAAFGLSSMAIDVIELARGGDRLVDLDPIPFSIRDILGSVQDIVHPIAEEKASTQPMRRVARHCSAHRARSRSR